MDDPRWLRLITVGLILAALVVIYFLFSGSFFKGKTVSKSAQELNQAVVVSPSPEVFPGIVPGSSTPSAYEKIVDRSQGNVRTLPRTGLPLALAVTVSLSVVVSGWFLRKYPD